MNDIDYSKIPIPNFDNISSPDVSRFLSNILEDAQEEKKKLEEQRLATLNILEDVQRAQEELAAKYDYINNIRNLLEELTVSTNVEDVLKASFTTFQKILKCNNLAFLYTDNIFISFEDSFDKNYQEFLKEEFFSASKIKTEKINFKFIKRNVSGNIDSVIKKGLIVPVSTKHINSQSEKILGFLYFSCFGDNNKNTQDQKQIINDIVNLIALNIERIEALDASEHSKIGDLLQSMIDGVLMFDTDKKIIIFNPTIKKITGIQKETPSLSQFISLFKDFNLEEKIDEALKNEKTIYIKEANLLNLDYEITITPVRDYKKIISGGAIILHDITQLTEINKMKSEFVSVAAHQLRTPLGSMRWSIEMLLDNSFGELPQPVKQVLEQAHTNNIRMINLVNNLLNVSKVDEGGLKNNPELTDILKTTQEIVKEVEMVAKQKSVYIEITVKDDQSFEIMIDPNNFRMVLENILANAINYNRPDGKVLVSFSRDKDNIQIVISDTGIGIPKKDQSKLFTKFFRATNAISSKTEGSGLGLFVVKSYIESWGGTIDFESEENKGTTFTITIPAVFSKKLDS